MNAVIKADRLTKQFGDFVAVDHISFEINPGEIFGFLGANGAGKTTAMRMLCGLSRPSSGRAEVAGFDAARYPEEIKKHIGYMSQRFSLYGDLTVAENIRFFGGVYGLGRRQIKEKSNELIARLQLQKEAGQLVRSLPLGWKQRLAFSIAILHDPKIVFLDEPTGGVDPLSRKQFWDLIYETADKGITIFVTTHYLDEAEYCDRLSIMVDGRIDVLGSPGELKAKFKVETMEDVFYLFARRAKNTE